MQYNEQDLFDRLVKLESDKLTISDDIKQLKKDFTFHKKTNPSGLDKLLVSQNAGAAKLEAQRDYEEKREKTLGVFRKFEERTNYQD